MDIFGIGTDSLRLSERSLNMVSKATLATAANIANSETPGYKAVNSDFESSLRLSLASGSNPNIAEGGLKLTNARHIPMKTEENQKFVTDSGAERWDGNNVDMEREVSRLSELDMQYSIYATIVDSELSGLREAVDNRLK